MDKKVELEKSVQCQVYDFTTGKAKKSINIPNETIVDSDYFSRFRFDLEELLQFFQSSSGKKYSEIPLVFQCLEDLGFWSILKQDETFVMTLELEAQLRNQFGFLKTAFSYKVNDILIWADVKKHSSRRYIVKVIEIFGELNNKIYRVEVLDNGATFLAKRFELDYWNSAGGTLPQDHLVEEINWDQDSFWRKKLNDFKLLWSSKQILWNPQDSLIEISQKQKEFLVALREYFTLPMGINIQNGKGIGYLACGQGSYEDSSLVMALALQAFGQPLGIRSRLWGVERNDVLTPSFVLIRTSSTMDELSPWKDLILNSQNHRPFQRPLSEVLRKIGAKGPFGLSETEELSSLTEDSAPMIEDINLEKQ